MRTKLALALLAVVVVAGAGCSAFDPLTFGPGPKAASTLPAKAVMVVRTTAETSLENKGEACSLAVEPGVIRTYLADPLKEMGVFKVVEVLDPNTPGEPLELSRERNADFLVSVEVKGHKVRYQGKNGWFYPNIGIWFFTWVAAWWVPDEHFTATLDLEMVVREASDGAEVFRKTFQMKAEQNLNDFNRGWTIFSLLNTSFDAANYRDAAEHLDKRLWSKMRPAVLGALSKDIPQAVADSGWVPPLVNRVIVAGYGTAGAVEDAKKMAAFLMKRRWYKKEQLQVIVGPPPGTKGREGEFARDFKAAIAKWKALDFPERDTAFLYFAGIGTVAPGNVPSLVAGLGEKNLVSVPELLELLKTFRRSALMADAGFDNSGGGRSDKRNVTIQPKPFLEGLAKSPVLCVFGAPPGLAALEDAPKGPGTLTRLFMDGLTGRADLDRNRRVSWSELSQYVASQYQSLSSMMGLNAKALLHAPAKPWVPYAMKGPKRKKPAKRGSAKAAGGGGKPPAKKPAKKPTEKKPPAKKPTGKKPAEKPAKKPGEKAPAKKPADKPAEKKPGEKAPAKKPADKPAEKKPGEKAPAKKPADKPAEKGGDKAPEEKPADKPTEKKPTGK